MMLIETMIVTRLIEEMDRAGFVPVQWWDGEEYQPVTWKHDSMVGKPLVDAWTKAALICINSVDEGTLHFAPKTDLKAWGNRGVLLILGNGEDIISDYHVAKKAPEFEAAIERVYAWINENGNNARSGLMSDGQLDSAKGHGGKTS